MSHVTSRNEIIMAVLRVSAAAAFSYFSIRWLVLKLDPQNKTKTIAAGKAREQLSRLVSVGTKKQNFAIDQLTDYEMMIASHLIVPEDITVSWADVAGLDNLIKDLRETVFLPIKKKNLFTNSRLTQPPKGVLLYGPPGCGKTLIAKATAKEAGTRFINLDIAMLVDKWYGESQKLTAAVFSLAVKLQPCIIFIDEIDSLLRSRNRNDHEATAMMKAQFMSLWDGLITDPECTVIVMGATNRPSDLDSAIQRRMPATFHVSMPIAIQREKILRVILTQEPIDSDVDFSILAAQTDGFSGADLHEMCRQASVYRIKEYMDHSDSAENTKLAIVKQYDVRPEFNYSSATTLAVSNESSSKESEEEFHDTLRPITMEDLSLSLDKLKASKSHTVSVFRSLT